MSLDRDGEYSEALTSVVGIAAGMYKVVCDLLNVRGGGV